MNAQIASSIISFLAFCVSIAALWAMRSQRRIDNLVSLQSFLHAQDLSDARRAIREGLVVISLDEPKVRRVCSSFDFAGCLVKHNAVNRRIFLDYWTTPILTVASRLDTISERTTGPGTKVREYYRDFWWLIAEAHKVEASRSRKSG